MAITDFSEEGGDEERYTEPDEDDSIERKPFIIENDAYSSIENGSKKFKTSGLPPYATNFKSTNMSGFATR